MKKLIAALLSIFSLSASAYEITGVQMLEGSIKTQVRVGSIKTTCKVKVKKVKNLMREDQYGNPAYKVVMDVSLSGGSFMAESSKKVRFDKEVTMDNLFPDGVRDLEYKGGGITLKITEEGRLSQVSIPMAYETIICNFQSN